MKAVIDIIIEMIHAEDFEMIGLISMKRYFRIEYDAIAVKIEANKGPSL